LEDEELIPGIIAGTFKRKVKELKENYCPLIVVLTIWSEFLKAAEYKIS